MRRKIIAIVLSLMLATVFTPVFSFATGVDLSSGYTVLFVDDQDMHMYDGNAFQPEVIVVNDEFWSGESSDTWTYENYSSEEYTDTWRSMNTVPTSDYDVTYAEDSINAGNKVLTITGKGTRIGSFTANYYIIQRILKFTKTVNDDYSVSLKAKDSINLTGATVEFYNEDYTLKSDEYSISGDTVTIKTKFLKNYAKNTLNHDVGISTKNYSGTATVRSYNISKLPHLGNIKKVYNGKNRSLTNSDIGMNDSTMGKEYTVSYSKSSRKAIGEYKYTIKGKAPYVGSQTKNTFKIIPKRPYKITSAKRTKTTATIKWKKVANCSGYQVQLVRYSTADSDMTSYVVYKKKTLSGKSKLSTTFKDAKKSKYSKVRVRAYKTVNGQKIYSKWKYRTF